MIGRKAKVVEVEKKEKESAQRANDLASEALQAEKARVAAVQKEAAPARQLAEAERASKKEAAAARQLAEAERASKSVAQEEAKGVEAELAAAQVQLERERDLASKIGADAMKALSQEKSIKDSIRAFSPTTSSSTRDPVLAAVLAVIGADAMKASDRVKISQDSIRAFFPLSSTRFYLFPFFIDQIDAAAMIAHDRVKSSQ
eukprot:gene5936-33511_t